MPSYISSIGTAVPENKITQKEILHFMQKHIPLSDEKQKMLEVLYRASGIKTRHSVIPDYGGDVTEYSFYPNTPNLEPFPDIEKRMKLYESEAIKLAAVSVQRCLDAASVNASNITHLITVSCTGMYAPGIDIDLVEKLGLATEVTRTNVNFMGCYAAFNGLKIAHEIACNDPDANVLVVCVELCSIHFQKAEDEDNLLSGALFADGAAAVLVQGQKNGRCFEMSAFHSDLELSAKSEMSWKVSNHGFLMKLSPQVPETIKKGIRELTERLLHKIGLSTTEIDFYAIHPGGKRILEVIEQELGISKMDNLHAYEVLKAYGNMSSPTVLFVLKSLKEHLTEKDHGKNVLSFAFGPGLTLESMLLKTHSR